MFLAPHRDLRICQCCFPQRLEPGPAVFKKRPVFNNEGYFYRSLRAESSIPLISPCRSRSCPPPENPAHRALHPAGFDPEEQRGGRAHHPWQRLRVGLWIKSNNGALLLFAQCTPRGISKSSPVQSTWKCGPGKCRGLALAKAMNCSIWSLVKQTALFPCGSYLYQVLLTSIFPHWGLQAKWANRVLRRYIIWLMHLLKGSISVKNSL
ncbi:hypothetical protein BB050_03879 [Flavobacterium anhuiense]|uniref:Uncharacterized protein n=1 Tax=Flavobacterium anhuiense TaxID=459526 RepID=A0AAC9D5L0_9FLAO|nr:hypothetical protein BB050_03879 [Flavobacterium anhuiense]